MQCSYITLHAIIIIIAEDHCMCINSECLLQGPARSRIDRDIIIISGGAHQSASDRELRGELFDAQVSVSDGRLDACMDPSKREYRASWPGVRLWWEGRRTLERPAQMALELANANAREVAALAMGMELVECRVRT